MSRKGRKARKHEPDASPERRESQRIPITEPDAPAKEPEPEPDAPAPAEPEKEEPRL